MFYRLRMGYGYDEVKAVAPGLAAAMHRTEGTLVRVRDREASRTLSHVTITPDGEAVPVIEADDDD